MCNAARYWITLDGYQSYCPKGYSPETQTCCNHAAVVCGWVFGSIFACALVIGIAVYSMRRR